MGNWQSVTLGDLGKAFARYRPFVAVVAAVVLVVAFLPGDQPTEVATGNFDDDASQQVTTGEQPTDTTAPTVSTDASTVATGGSSPAAAPARTGTGASAAAGGASGAGGAAAGGTQQPI